jgi:predicted MFS family arabinose efflux permease
VGVGSTMNNVSRIVGPALAGGLIAWFGIASCFYVNSASYLVCTATFLLMRRQDFEPTVAARGRAGNVRSGLRAVWRDPRLRTPLLMAVVIGMFAYENQISVPLLAKYTFGGDASSYGFLSSAMGVGSVIGGLIVARSGRANHRRQGYAALALGVAMLVASTMPTMGAMVVAMVVVGAASVGFVTMTSATLQLTAPTEMRGRVLALYVTALIGTTPIGGPIIGWIGEVVGPRATYVTGGLACVLTAAVAWRSLARSSERSVSEDEARSIEELAVREGEDIEAGAASAMPVNVTEPAPERQRRSTSAGP